MKTCNNFKKRGGFSSLEGSLQHMIQWSSLSILAWIILFSFHQNAMAAPAAENGATLQPVSKIAPYTIRWTKGASWNEDGTINESSHEDETDHEEGVETEHSSGSDHSGESGSAKKGGSGHDETEGSDHEDHEDGEETDHEDHEDGEETDHGDHEKGPKGIVMCANSAQTQSQITPAANSFYDPEVFLIDVTDCNAIDPSNGNPVEIKNPKEGEPVIWFNFDVRAYGEKFSIQINGHGNADDIAWALYVSDAPENGIQHKGYDGKAISGSDGNLMMTACGISSTSRWGSIPLQGVDISQTMNFYMAIWDMNEDGDVKLNNFKARKGCAEYKPILCKLSAGPEIVKCGDETTYQVIIPVLGKNAKYVAVDPNALSISDAICFGNKNNGKDTTGTFILTYPLGVAYDIIVMAEENPQGCAEPENFEECVAYFSGESYIPLKAKIIPNDITCYGEKGSLSLDVCGGTAPYEILWCTGHTSKTISDLSPLNYFVVITDANGCSVKTAYVLKEPDEIQLDVDIVKINCEYPALGKIFASASNGQEPYMYSIDNGETWIENNTFSGLWSGVYQVVVQDANGCVQTGVAEIPAMDCSFCDIASPHENELKAFIDGIKELEIDEIKLSSEDGYEFSISSSDALWDVPCGIVGKIADELDKLIALVEGGKTISVEIIFTNNKLGWSQQKSLLLSPDGIATHNFDVIGQSTSHIKAYPNPFINELYFEFSSKVKSTAVLELYDIKGVKLAEVFNNDIIASQNYSVHYDASDIPKGTLIIYKLVTNTKVITGKLVKQ